MLTTLELELPNHLADKPLTKSTRSLATIIVDTREQQPYTFGEQPVIRRALRAGDYSLEGYQESIAIERKSLNDYVNTIIHNDERFKAELTLLRDYKAKAIVVEGTLEQVFAQAYTSKASPASVIGLTNSILIIYKVPVVFAGNRQLALAFTQKFLSYAKNVVTEEIGRDVDATIETIG